MGILKIKNTEVSLTLVTDKAIKRLNHSYRQINKPTDVLSFDQDIIVAGKTMLGDIVISTETTRKQALAAGKTFKEEFCMLSIHGLLHLLGYDHATAKEEKVMFTLQNSILKKVLDHV